MALHPNFPKSRYEVLDPANRWFPAAEELRATAYEKLLLPPLVAKAREEVRAWRVAGYAGASVTSRALLTWWFETHHTIEQADGPDNDFHRLLAKGSRNRWLENLLVKDVYSLLRLYRMQAARRPDVTDSLAEHHTIINRLHARDGEGAEAAMRAHLRGSRARMLEAASG